MKIKIIALGKIKERFLKEGIDEFLKRLTPYASVEITELAAIEIKDPNLTAKVLDEEAEKILKDAWHLTNAIKSTVPENLHLRLGFSESVSHSLAPLISSHTSGKISRRIFSLFSPCSL